MRNDNIYNQLASYHQIFSNENNFDLYKNPLFQALKLVSYHVNDYTQKDLFKSLEYFSILFDIQNRINHGSFLNISLKDIKDINEVLEKQININKTGEDKLGQSFIYLTSTNLRSMNLIEEFNEVKNVINIKLKKIRKELDICIDTNSRPKLNKREYSINFLNLNSVCYFANEMKDKQIDKIGNVEENIKDLYLLSKINDDLDFEDQFVKTKFVSILKSNEKINKYLEIEDLEKSEKIVALKEINQEILKIVELMGVNVDQLSFIQNYIRSVELDEKLKVKENIKSHIRVKV
jgi:hypothetical protein